MAERQHSARGLPRTTTRSLRAALTYIILVPLACTMLAPLAWQVTTSLKGSGAIISGRAEWLPKEQVQVTVNGESRPVFRATIEGRETQVALLRRREEMALVAPVADNTVSERQTLVPFASLEPVWEIKAHWENYPQAWRAIFLRDFRLLGLVPVRSGFAMFYLNSLFVASLVTAGCVFTSSLAAFALSRLRYRGRDVLFLGYLATMMVPFMVMIIPVFIMFRRWGLIDTYAALILPGVFSAYGTFLLRQFFLSVPTELEEAARLDGCGRWGIYRHVVIPLSKPALATLTTFTFLHTWNEFMWPLVAIHTEWRKTLPIGLATFRDLYTTDWPRLMAAATIFILPVVIIFLLNQRYFIRGIILSGLKG